MIDYKELKIGDGLGDAHYINRGLARIINDHLGSEQVEVKSQIAIPGRLHDILNAILQKTSAGERFRAANKMIYVIAHNLSSPGLVVGWSYDDAWLGFAVVVPREAHA